MEYYRDPKNRIQAGVAHRVGLLLKQYDSLAHCPSCSSSLPVSERYDATLLISALLVLLTNCAELRRSMTEARKRPFRQRLTEVPLVWGVKVGDVENDTINDRDLTLGQVLDHLRDALSHPTAPTHDDLPSTGYSTLVDRGEITHFRFVNSPWTDNGRLQAKYRDPDRAGEAVAQWCKKHLHLTLQCDDGHNAVITLERDGKPYLPVFSMLLPVARARVLADELATYLAQPVQEQWDGRTVAALATLRVGDVAIG